MRTIYRFSVILLLCIIITSNVQNAEITNKHTLLGFDDIKIYIAKYESSNGKFKIHRNTNGSVDCGIYQINSSNFRIKYIDSIITSYGIPKDMQSRINAVIHNDVLCEDIAREFYYREGLDKWCVYHKVLKHIDGFYITSKGIKHTNRKDDYVTIRNYK